MLEGRQTRDLVRWATQAAEGMRACEQDKRDLRDWVQHED